MAAAVSYASGQVAIFNVRLDDDLAARFDGWALERGGRSAALRRLISDAAKRGETMSAEASPRLALPLKLTVRLSANDGRGLDIAAVEMGLTRNAWAAAVLRRRLRDRPTLRPDDEASFMAIQTELRRIGVNVNQIARALNTAVMEGRVLDLELSALNDLRRELRSYLEDLREAIEGNLSYWAAAA